METNNYLHAQEALDVSVLLKNVSDEMAFQMVVNLFIETHKEISSLEEYFDYIWEEYGCCAKWEYAVEKHNDSQAQLSELQERLGDLLAEQAKDWRGIPQLIGDRSIDIKYLLYEMPSDLGIDFISKYLEHIEYVLRHFELEKGSKNETDERKRVEESLKDLQDQLIAIRNNEAYAEKEWEKELAKLEEAEEQERREMREWVNNREIELTTSEITIGEKEAAIAAVTSNND